MKVVIVGAGWAGISAAYEARKQGADVVLIEKTDMILGTGLVGGIMRNNGRFTAIEELKYMGADTLVDLVDENCIHKNVDFPGHKHASLYSIATIEEALKSLLTKMGVEILLETRIHKVELEDKKIISVISDKKEEIAGDVFIDTTGSGGPMNMCIKYGNGCAMCTLRCPTFGGRVSLTSLCGITELMGMKKDGTFGAMSGSCKLLKETLADNIIRDLEKNGYSMIPLEQDFIEDHLDMKACQQYALKEYKDNLILLDTGHAKLMTPFYPLEKLRRIKGFENAKYIDPYSGGKGNSMRFFSIAPHDNTMQVNGVDNLFCAGEKVFLVGHTEAMFTGVLAGYNAVKLIRNEKLLELPLETVIGSAISFVNQQLNEEGLKKKYTVSGTDLFTHIQEKGLYSNDKKEIQNKVKHLSLDKVF